AVPGRYPLIFTIESDGSAEVLAATLDVPIAAARETPLPAKGNDGLLSRLKERITQTGPLLILAFTIAFVLGAAIMRLLARRKLVPAVALLAFSAAVLTTAALAHEGEDHGGAAVNAAIRNDRDIARRLADGSLFVPKATQRLLAIRTDLTTSA